jgi:hypothetical protein
MRISGALQARELNCELVLRCRMVRRQRATHAVARHLAKTETFLDDQLELLNFPIEAC